MSPIERLGADGETWNPLVGCGDCELDYCYARACVWRLAHNPKLPAETREKYARVVTNRCEGYGTGRGPIDWTGEIAYFPERLEIPLRWRKPRRVFVGSMGDMFAEGVKFEWLHQVFAAIAIASKHTFIVLTKRPERMLEYFNVTNIESAVNRAAKELIEKYGTKEARWNLSRRQSAWAAIVPWPPPNLLTGISAGDQAHLEERLGWLAHVPGRHDWWKR